jgi:leucyl-tRNA synthetase
MREQNGPNGPFVSLSVADDFESGFTRINANEGDLVSYTISTEVWVELLAIIVKTTGAKAQTKMSKGKRPAKYVSFDKIVKLVIEQNAPIKVVRKNRVDAITISGDVKAVTSRDKRAGNGISLD